MDDPTAPPDSPFPKWEINEVSANETDFVSLNQDGQLSFETILSGKAIGDIYIRAKFCETLSWQTITIKSVDVDNVEINKKSVGLNEVFTLKAIPTSGDIFPDDGLIWEYNYKQDLVGNFEGWKDFKHAGEQTFEEKLGKSGVYKFHAKCCENGKWVESKEFYVVEIKELQVKLCDTWVKAEAKDLESLCEETSVEMKAIPSPSVNDSKLPETWVIWSGIHDANNVGSIIFNAEKGKIKAQCGSSEKEIELNIVVDTKTEIKYNVNTVPVLQPPSTFEPKKDLIKFLEIDACLDIKEKKWYLVCKKFDPEATIEIFYGVKNPTSPYPTTEAETQIAINDLLNYWSVGGT